MAQFPNLTPDERPFPDDALPTTHPTDDRVRQIADQEQSLADARAAFRRERDAERTRLSADRDEADRLLREARTANADATRRRDRTRRLAYRYARRVRQKWADARAELAAGRAALDESRGQLSAEVARFEILRSEFHTTAAASKDRLREGWEALDRQRRRAAAESAAAAEQAVAEHAALATRAADLDRRERTLASARATLEAATTGLRAEAAGLESRIQNARAVVEELERQRDQLRAELLGSLAPPDQEPPAELRVALDRAGDRDLTQWAADLVARDTQLNREKDDLAAARADLARETTDLADQRRIVAEQFHLLATARDRWQEAERGTVGEMEELASGLRRREQELDAREETLIRTDARRREEAYDLWQCRLRLESWQSKLSAVEKAWHAGRELRDVEYARRVRAITRREEEIDDLLTRWERARDSERERLGSELRLWADDRERMIQAAEGYDRQAREVLAELVAHAARAMASEERLAELAPEATSGRARRRVEVLQKRWEQVFRRKLTEIDDRRAAASAELARLDERYREFHRVLVEATRVEGASTTRLARSDAAGALAAAPSIELGLYSPATAAPTNELVTLRAEFERMAAVLIQAGVPEAPDSELPWAAEEPGTGEDILPFAPQSRAA